jgi:enterochelin esterase-like enzyme
MVNARVVDLRRIREQFLKSASVFLLTTNATGQGTNPWPVSKEFSGSNELQSLPFPVSGWCRSAKCNKRTGVYAVWRGLPLKTIHSFQFGGILDLICDVNKRASFMPTSLSKKIKVYCWLFSVLFNFPLAAQDYSEFTFLSNAIQVADSTTRESIWTRLRADKKIPLVAHDSVAFLFRGQANTVAWMGDFNAWGYDKKFVAQGKLIGRDFWILKASFPVDARLDYKILLNGSEWRLDPNNPFQQWSGVGGGSPNSELRMPKWKEDAAHAPRPIENGGQLSEDILFHSTALGYQVTYKIYTPPNYETLSGLPIMYVTDGYEYLHPKMGNMVNILDNLILDKKIKPLVTVFVDHREPVNRSNNRRMEELAINAKYLNFFTEELVPHVEKDLKVSRKPTERGILGTSMGGLSSAYFAFTRPDVFGLCGIQSPSFNNRPKIYTICDSPDSPKIKVSMTSGVIHDASDGTRKMKAILEDNACVYFYKEVNEGHSWGNWRNLIDDILVDFFALK